MSQFDNDQISDLSWHLLYLDGVEGSVVPGAHSSNNRRLALQLKNGIKLSIATNLVMPALYDISRVDNGVGLLTDKINRFGAVLKVKELLLIPENNLSDLIK